MEAQQIKAFIDAMASSDLAEMSFSQDGWTLRLVRRSADAATPVAAAPAAAPARSASGPRKPLPPAAAPASAPELLAPLFGVVHLQAGPGEPPYVAAGQAVRAGQTLCVIEAMKVFNEVRAEADAVVDAVLVRSGQEVDAGQPLLRLR
ncbi:acetyl-CoA carboxylase biotin carboxyl carrier protein subunit [Aquincola sp. S2]|uniref:Biotin carboxyl carrier protein of acetyl-CoA carboxylase n=1 Tax=Pseudaquabacterium terrae TaxID=2732868 RepID=A0ABX2EGE8_9BURK|nr:acetyl-CoA carboxylase biotin carboxyl carrier protein subunit [Aquabacterium terrae]NRF67700.1 acetyl-CoA carboxylase biotin carboxyl carrier protein subunit [Aquabacterium terrae]